MPPFYGLPPRYPIPTAAAGGKRFYGGSLAVLERRNESLPTLTGVAVEYERTSPVGGTDFFEYYDPEVFNPFGDVLAHPEHNPDVILGRTGSGTLRLKNEDNRLQVELDLPNTTAGRDLAELARRGDVAGWSVGYRVQRAVWQSAPEGRVRRIIKAELNDVSPVARPALRGTPLKVG